MEMEQYKPNSHKSKGEEESSPRKPRVERIVEGRVVKRKASLGSRIRDAFLAGETETTIGALVLFGVIIPGLKDLLFETITEGLQRSLFGDGGSTYRRSASSRRNGGNTNYSKISTLGPSRGSYARDPEISDRGRARHNFDEIVLSSRGEAQQVLDRLIDLVDTYEIATVGDLYDLVGITENFTDQKWGWTNLASARISRVGGGYLLNLPRPQPLD